VWSAEVFAQSPLSSSASSSQPSDRRQIPASLLEVLGDGCGSGDSDGDDDNGDDDDDEGATSPSAAASSSFVPGLTGARPVVAVVRRGGCSFLAKAQRAQARGFGALVVVDFPPPPPPPPAPPDPKEPTSGAKFTRTRTPDDPDPPMVADPPGNDADADDIDAGTTRVDAVTIPVFLVRGGDTDVAVSGLRLSLRRAAVGSLDLAAVVDGLDGDASALLAASMGAP